MADLNVRPAPSAAPAVEAVTRFGMPRGPKPPFTRPEVELGQDGQGYSSADLQRFASMPAEEVARLQRQLRTAGLLSGSYRYGYFDPSTASAMQELFSLANTAGQDYRNILTDLTAQGGVAEWRRQQRAKAELARSDVFQTRTDRFERTDPASIRLAAESAFREALGRKPKKAELDRFVKRMQDTEFNIQRRDAAFADAELQRRRDAELGAFAAEQEATSPAVPGDVGLDGFMQALAGQESGGDYNARNGRTGAAGKFQIMPGNWAPWAAEAGLGRNAPRTPENQERVARFKMQQYYDQFGSWDAVAVAWYAGPGAVSAWKKDPNAARFTRKQGKGNEPSINEYVSQVRNRLGPVATVPGQKQPGAMTGEQELNARVAAMMADAPGKISINSAKRTREQQQVLYDRYRAGKGNKAAKPGSSKHETGEANDLAYQNDSVRQWVLQNAHKYGLIFPVSGENWHVEVARGQKAQFGPQKGVRFGAGAMPGNAAQPVSAAPPNDGLMAATSNPLSTSYSTTNLDIGAQATEYARNVNPTETQAFDIGQQFNNFVSLLNRGVGV